MERTLDSTLLHIVKTRLVQDYPRQVRICLDALSEEQIWWRPNEQANAVGNLIVHLAGSNRYYFEHAIAGQPTDRDRDAEFAARGGRSKDDLIQLWESSVRSSAGVLESLDPSRLTETTERTGKPTTFAQILLHVSHHNALHVGQVLWATKLLQPGSLVDIGIKLRGR